MSDWARYHGLHSKASAPKAGYREDLPHIWLKSSWEANFLRYLIFMQEYGSVAWWKYESKIFWFKDKQGPRSYKPDFEVCMIGGQIEYDEVKGWDYERGRIARERMALYYPDIKLVLIDEKWFEDAYRRGWWRMIPGWERPERRKSSDKSDAST